MTAPTGGVRDARATAAVGTCPAAVHAPSVVPSVGAAGYSHVWRAVTGGGTAADYLKWLAAQWALYAERTGQRFGHRRVKDKDRAAFGDWLRARFGEELE